MHPKRSYTKMSKAKDYFACSGWQWQNIRDSQLASSWPYMAWRGELKPLLWAVPASRYFLVSQNSAILWLTAYCYNCGCQVSQSFFFLHSPEARWSVQIAYEIWKKHCNRMLKSRDALFVLEKHTWAQIQSKQKRLPLVIFWYRSHADCKEA